MKQFKIQIKFYHDASHGWYRIHLHDLRLLGLQGEISPWSYVDYKNGWIYLEEDSDADKLFKAIELNKHICSAYLLKPQFYKREARLKKLPSYICWPIINK